MNEQETKTEVVSCDLKFYLENQNSDNAWIKNGGWRPMSVETTSTSHTAYKPLKQIVWLIRTVKITPGKIEVL